MDAARRERNENILSLTEPIGSDETNAMVGRRIGLYQVAAQIGTGGIGSVYRATQSDEFAQQVAVKLIKRRMDSNAIVRRFQTEIHVQAALGKHPNITALLEAGTTEEGRSYFVMEYVDGQWIDEYCDSHRLDIPSRLRLFGKVCEAVHFAHQHAVIHGDLKPSNILVTTDGIPKLIDFGITKLVHPERDDDDDPGTVATVTLTQSGELVLTPEYASPEQVKGELITTASDIYALGIVLYLLLTGHRPYRLKTRSTSEVFQAICEQVPEKPSTSVVRRMARWSGSSGGTTTMATPIVPSEPSTTPTLLSTSPSPAPSLEEIAAARGTPPKRLARILAGDLDTIVLMALRKEPERRYTSAQQFADDVHRYLKGLPVLAHRDSSAYRVVKLVQRHAVAVATTVVLVLLLLAGIVSIMTGLILARRDRDRAEDSFRQAHQALNQFFTRVSEERLLNQPGLHPLRNALLKDAQQFYEHFLNQRGGDPSLRAELAATRARVAQITSLTGSTTEAVLQYQQAVALWESLVASQPDNTTYQENLARTLNELGVVLIPLDGRGDEALGIFRRAQKLIEPLTAVDPPSVPIRHELGLLLQNIARIERDQGQPEKAIKSIQRSLAIESQLAAEDPHALNPLISMAKAHGLLGQIMAGQPDGLEPALAAYQQAVDLLASVTREHPELADQSYELAMFLGDLSSFQQMAGKLDSALTSAQKALVIFERLDRRYPGLLNYQEALGAAYNMMSDVHRHRREPAESLTFAQKAQTLLGQLVSEHPKDVSTRIDLAKSYNNVARILQQTGEPVEALRSYQRAVDLYESIPSLDPRNNYNLTCNLALCIPLIGTKNGSQGTLDTLKLSKGDQLRRQIYSDRAVEVLRRAVASGFLNPEILQSDPDIDSIRDRPDFQALIKDVEKNQQLPEIDVDSHTRNQSSSPRSPADRIMRIAT